MGVVVERSARSPLLVEGRDFSLGIYDADGTLLEQTEYIPVLGYATTPGDAGDRRALRRQRRPGDVDAPQRPLHGRQPALATGRSTKPVFHEGEHVAWVVIAAHQADVGGAVPGSYNPNATDMWQEGLRITPLKLYERRQAARTTSGTSIFGNVRLDDRRRRRRRDDRRLHGRRARAQARCSRATGPSAFARPPAALLDAAERTAAAVDRADRRRQLPRPSGPSTTTASTTTAAGRSGSRSGSRATDHLRLRGHRPPGRRLRQRAAGGDALLGDDRLLHDRRGRAPA